jgi:sulfur-oxidizing protein SoxX
MRLTLLAAALVALTASPVGAGDRRPLGYEIVDGAEAPAPLVPGGNAVRGAALAADPRAGCLGCHDGAAAPSLAGVASRRSPGRLRLAVIHYGVIDPAVPNHAFYHVLAPGEGPEAQTGETLLTAAEVEDLVAWLAGLRD